MEWHTFLKNTTSKKCNLLIRTQCEIFGFAKGSSDGTYLGTRYIQMTHTIETDAVKIKKKMLYGCH